MGTRLVRWVIAGFIYFGFVFVLSGCFGFTADSTEVRNLPDEVRIKLSSGDTRQKARSVLGDPLINAQNFGVEVYLQSGRDLEVIMAPFPIPMPFLGTKIHVYVLVAYDDNWVVKGIDTIITPRKGGVHEANAGGFQLKAGFDLSYNPLEILYAPVADSRESLSQVPPPGQCKVFFALTGWGFETILVDGEKIVDDFASILISAEYVDLHSFTEHAGDTKRLGFFWKLFPPGTHEVEVRRTQHYSPQIVSHSLHCESAQARYVHIVDIPLDGKFDVEFNVSNELPDTFIGRREIIFVQGTWLGDSN